MPPVIEVQHLSKSFGKHAILDDISLSVNEGDVYGLVGLNGAGKTTLIRLLLGVLKADKGEVTVRGSDPWRHDAALCRRMGVVLEHDGFWGNLTFEQNMKIFAAAKGLAWTDASAYIEEFWRSTDLYKNKKAVKYYSRGMRMQCALCRAFLGWPAVCFLDEPAIALDVGAYEHLKGVVAAVRAKGAAFIISSHQLDAIDDLCNRVGMLRDRRLAELSRQTSRRPGHALWHLDADNTEAWATVIREVCGSEPVWEGGAWQFEVTSAETTVPILITKLAAAGCRIGKIAPAENGFSDTIRSEYRRKAGAESEGGSP